MNEFSKLIQNSTDISDNDKYYWFYMYNLGKDVLVPLLSEMKVFKSGDKVAEIGSAEGGVLAAFVEVGAKEALGTDINQPRLEMGEFITAKGGVNIEYVYHNIIDDEVPAAWLNKYDLILLRDVIEHLEDPATALRNIYKLLKPGGYLYVTFPPYRSPFGGHQHTVASSGGKIPWIHLLPSKLFLSIIKNGRARDIVEVKRLMDIRLSPEKFVNVAKGAGYSIYKQDYYLLRPVFKMKFGLPAIKMKGLDKISLVRNYLCTEAGYVLQK